MENAFINKYHNSKQENKRTKHIKKLMNNLFFSNIRILLQRRVYEISLFIYSRNIIVAIIKIKSNKTEERR